MPRLTWRSLVERYGLDEAERLCSEFGGCRFPKLSPKLRQRIDRDREILDLLDDGAPATEVAEVYQITKERVIQIGKTSRGDSVNA